MSDMEEDPPLDVRVSGGGRTQNFDGAREGDERREGAGKRRDDRMEEEEEEEGEGNEEEEEEEEEDEEEDEEDDGRSRVKKKAKVRIIHWLPYIPTQLLSRPTASPQTPTSPPLH
jgi:hypothetical protein